MNVALPTLESLRNTVSARCQLNARKSYRNESSGAAGPWNVYFVRHAGMSTALRVSLIGKGLERRTQGAIRANCLHLDFGCAC